MRRFIHQHSINRDQILVIGILLIPALIVVFRGWNGFAYPSANARYSDLTLSHHAFIDFIRQQIFVNHTFPFWYPTILSGTPLIANPLAGIWYPFGWPAFFLPAPFIYNLLVGLHLSWGATGMYLLLRQQGLNRISSLFGGLAFGLMPKLFAHYGAGHLTLLYAVPWTPWLLFSTRIDSKFKPILSAMILALIFLADVRWAVYAGLLWLLWLVFQTYGNIKPSTREKIRYIVIMIPIAALLSACLALPMVEYSSLSTRANLTSEDVFFNSLTYPGLLGIFYPPLQGGAHETVLYYGSIVLLLALLAALQFTRNRSVRFWSLVSLGAIFFALGSNLPILTPIAHLPIISLLRVPTRALFILGLGLAFMAAISVDGLAHSTSVAFQRKAKLLIAALVSFICLISVMVLYFWEATTKTPFIWGMIAVLAAAILIWLRLNRTIVNNIFIAGCFILLILDTGLASQTMLAFRSEKSVWAPYEPIATYLTQDTALFRSYSPSFSLLQHVAASFNIQMADGVDPLQLRSYSEFMKSASGIPWDVYSVTLPATMPGEDGNALYSPDTKLLGLLNVKYILADFDLPASDGLALAEQIGETRIYENLNMKPRAWAIIQEPGGEPLEHPITDITWTPNRIALSTRGPGQLFLSEIAYPGWQATVNGENVEIHTAGGVLRSVDLHNQQQQVDFVFRPASFYLGFTISVIAWLALLVILWRSRSPEPEVGRNETSLSSTENHTPTPG
jgi:hypothetical protein